jgi:hypothetical protein
VVGVPISGCCFRSLGSVCYFFHWYNTILHGNTRYTSTFFSRWFNVCVQRSDDWASIRFFSFPSFFSILFAKVWCCLIINFFYPLWSLFFFITICFVFFYLILISILFSLLKSFGLILFLYQVWSLFFWFSYPLTKWILFFFNFIHSIWFQFIFMLKLVFIHFIVICFVFLSLFYCICFSISSLNIFIENFVLFFCLSYMVLVPTSWIGLHVLRVGIGWFLVFL